MSEREAVERSDWSESGEGGIAWPEPTVLAQGTHPITPSLLAKLSPQAVWAMERLRWNGYLAYLVGGAVRDLLLGSTPKDFDLTTNARPSEISSLFYNCRIIGRRFRIAHVYFRRGDILEISTFRSLPSERLPHQHSQLVEEDNEFGSPTEDAWRRDLTVNGIFYDSGSGAVIDHVGGLMDLRDGIARVIGEPNSRFREDPVRMIRAIRHAARLRLSFAPETWDAIGACANHIQLCSSARLLEEFLRELRGAHVALIMRLADDSGLLEGWIPSLHRWLRRSPEPPKGVPPGRFGPWVDPSWGSADAFWSQLLAVGEQIRRGVKISDWVLLSSFVLARCWSEVYARCKPGTGTRHLWREAVDGPIRSFFREISLSGRDSEKVRRLLQTYWRLHLYPNQNSLERSLRSSPFLPEAVQLFSFELIAQGIEIPDWLDRFKS